MNVVSAVFLLVVIGAALQPILARYQSRCGICDSLIVEDEEIVEVDGEWVHADCAEAEGVDQ